MRLVDKLLGCFVQVLSKIGNNLASYSSLGRLYEAGLDFVIDRRPESGRKE